ncbi:hypothetical protein HK405_007002 [Cladochytrium tenue]|nr:hypothetical protein HK405_007002 [Cladochytrium tenue]
MTLLAPILVVVAAGFVDATAATATAAAGLNAALAAAGGCAQACLGYGAGASPPVSAAAGRGLCVALLGNATSDSAAQASADAGGGAAANSSTTAADIASTQGRAAGVRACVAVAVCRSPAGSPDPSGSDILVYVDAVLEACGVMLGQSSVNVTSPPAVLDVPTA